MRYLIIGLGNRGSRYANEIKRGRLGKVVAIADPVKEKREKIVKQHKIKNKGIFKNGEDALKEDKLADAVIIATPDNTHYDLAMKTIRKRYHLLLEKPMATTVKQCSGLVATQEVPAEVFSICYVLRYAPFFQRIKKILDSGKLGKIQNIDLLEEVGSWHFAHSYVRGNWRRKINTGPVILTKSCHDMDLLSWMADSEVDTIESRGSLDNFKESNAPKKSTTKCITCKVRNCPYDATKLYLEDKKDEVEWPTSVISEDYSKKARKKTLEKGQYGKCVWKSDNTVNDNQDVIVEFSNGIHANFRLRYGSGEPNRKIEIYCEKGKIEGSLIDGEIQVTEYIPSFRKKKKKKIRLKKLGAHGGGDKRVIKNFYHAIKNNDPKKNLTKARVSLQSHLMAFAAAKSVEENKKIDFKKFMNRFSNNMDILSYCK